MPDHAFTPAERDLIRREFMLRMSSARRLHDGLFLRRWATGPRKGQPKLPAVVQGMLDRGLVEVDDDDRHFPRACFTPAGWEALRRMAADARQLDPARYAHMIAEIHASGWGWAVTRRSKVREGNRFAAVGYQMIWPAH